MGKTDFVKAATEAVASQVYNRIDANNDGVVDRVEANAAGISEQTFAKVDVNNDGELSKSEFVQAALPPVVEAAREAEEKSVADNATGHGSADAEVSQEA